MQFRILCAAALVASSNLFSFPADATDFYAAGGISLGNPPNSVELDSYEQAGGVQAGGGVNHDDFGPGTASLHAQANSLADIHGIRSHSFASISKLSDQSIAFGGQYFVGAYARSIFTDFLIEGTGSIVTVPISFHLTGEQTVGSSAGTEGRTNSADSSVAVTFRITSDTISQQLIGGFHTIQNANGVNAAPFESGILTGFDGDEILTLPAVVLPVGSFFTLELSLQTSTRLNYNSNEPTFTSGANAAFGSTLSFVTDGPIFGLPEGFTVNSVSAGVVDNQLAPVPLPATLWLFAPAIGGLALMRRRAA